MATPSPLEESFWQEYLSDQAAKLPPLSHVEDVTDRVVRIMGGNPGTMKLQGTNTYLVGTGQSRILIDTGEGSPEWIQRLIRVLQDRGLDISHVLLTHWHRDHTGGAPDLVAFDPSFAHRIYKNQPDRDQNPIEDGQVFAVEGATIRAVFTPGHAVDHMCFLLEEENALFTGDNVLGHGFSVVMDLAVYMNSLDYMAAKGCATGYPGHGAKIANLPAKMHEYIHHNEVRIQKVLSALTWKGTGMKGGMTLQEIIRSIYGDVQGDIADYALAPFLTQILWKLAEDGKVGFSPGEPKKARWFGLGGVRKATSIAASVVSDSD